jgi:hypothetical protein
LVGPAFRLPDTQQGHASRLSMSMTLRIQIRAYAACRHDCDASTQRGPYPKPSHVAHWADMVRQARRHSLPQLDAYNYPSRSTNATHAILVPIFRFPHGTHSIDTYTSPISTRKTTHNGIRRPHSNPTRRLPAQATLRPPARGPPRPLPTRTPAIQQHRNAPKRRPQSPPLAAKTSQEAWPG